MQGKTGINGYKMVWSVQDLNVAISIAFSWWGVLSFSVSTKLGGVVFIGISFCIFFLLLLYPDVLRFQGEEIYLKKAIISFLCFFVVSFCGYEFLYTKNDVKNFLFFDFSTNGFNLLKNFPFWMTGLLMLLKKRSNKNFFLFVLGYDVIVTTIALLAVPNYAKNAAAGILTNTMLPYARIGAMGYELAYSIAILIPVLLFSAKQSKSLFCLCFSILCCFYVYKTSFLIALIAMILNVALAVVFSAPANKIRIKVFFSVCFLVLALLIVYPHVGEVLLALSSKMKSVQLSERFYQLGRMFLAGDFSGETLVRFDLYGQSIKGIRENVIFGMALTNRDYAVSGHSTILDNWCLFGIFGVIPFFSMIVYMAKYTIELADLPVQKGIVLAAFLSFVFISFVNPVTSSPQILLTVLWALPVLVETSNMNCTSRKKLEN